MDMFMLYRLCLQEPNSHLTEVRGRRGNFHLVHCLYITGIYLILFICTRDKTTCLCYLYITLVVR